MKTPQGTHFGDSGLVYDDGSPVPPNTPFPDGTIYYGGTGQYSLFNPNTAGTVGYNAVNQATDANGNPVYGADAEKLNTPHYGEPGYPGGPPLPDTVTTPEGGSGSGAGDGWSEGSLKLSAADKARVDKMLSDVQSTDDPTYWYRLAAQHGGVDATGEGWLNDRIRRGDGSALVKNGTLTKFQDTPDTQGKIVDSGTVDTGDWFSANAPAAASYSQLARPDYLSQPYVPKQFTEQFTAPTMADLQNSAGYQSGADLLQKGLERSAAAKGSILSGGFAGIAEPRALANYAGTAYNNLFGQAYDTYNQKYKQFQDSQNADLAARGLNEATYQTDLGNNLNTYKTRAQAYQDAINNNFNLASLGLSATTAGNPGQPL